MSFSGRVKKTSHEGGLIASFEGRPPRLGTSIRITGGRVLGRVETVLGPVEEPLIHILPLIEGIDPRAAIGSPIEIAPRVRGGARGRKIVDRGGQRNVTRGKNYRNNGSRNQKPSRGRGQGSTHHRRKPAGKGSNSRRPPKGKRSPSKGRGGTRGRRGKY